MAAFEIVALDEATPQLRAPGSADTYLAPRAMAVSPPPLTGSAATPSLSISQTWNTTGTPTAFDLNVTDTASNASSNLIALRVAGVTQFRVRKDGSTETANAIGIGPINGSLSFYAAGNVGGGVTGMQQSSAAIIGWTSGAQAVGSADLVLRRDAANTLALRNGTNAQAFNVYNTFTDASNYERAAIGYSSNVLYIGHSAAGTGSITRDIVFNNDSSGSWHWREGDYGAGTSFTRMTLTNETSPQLRFRATASVGWTASASNANAALDTSLIRVDAGIVGVRGAARSDGAALSFIEQTAPAAPATNGVRIYAEDNGAGKTRLMALFATGAAQQIAIEP